MTTPTVHVEKPIVEGLPVTEAQLRWADLIAAYQGRIRCDFPVSATFRGQGLRARTVRYQLVTWRCTASRYHRTQGDIRRDPNDSQLFLVPLAGGLTVHQNGQALRLDPGTACLLRMTSPFALSHASRTRSLSLRLPPTRFADRAGTLTAMDLSAGIGGVIRTLLGGLLTELDSLSVDQFDAVADRLIELLGFLPAVAGPDGGQRRQLLALEARQYVRAHACDPDLNSESLAAALGWSLRQVQLALRGAGTTPRDLIREERLARARTMLLDPSQRYGSIGTLAHRAGFLSAKTFSTAFRDRYGLSPTQMREQIRSTS